VTATPPVAHSPSEVNPARLAIFGKPLPAQFESTANPISDDKVTLGRMLYYDKRLSRNQDISCNTCHDLKAYGVDGKKTSTGHKGQRGTRNSPTVYNAAGHFVQFWDGREPTIESQAGGPMINPVEMANIDHHKVELVLSSIPAYVDLFKKAFPQDPEPVNIRNATAAIGAFERKLVTPSRFDKFLAGDQTALTDAEKVGLNKFLDTGCTTCHLGTLLGGTMYQRAGLTRPWPNQTDPGRFQATKVEGDRMMFKVPSLRNITKTAPYFHDGGTDKLNDAVRMMALHQLGKELSDEDINSIVTFLGSLAGDIPAEFIKEPTLPPSTKSTPKPDPA
jgi:cytochrome c peroxidase